MNWTHLDWTILDRLRDGFLTGRAADGAYWQSHDDLAHYDFTFAERIGWKWDHVLAALQTRGWRLPTGAVLDWGCGSGVAGRRVLAAGGVAPITGVKLRLCDHSSLAEEFATLRARQVFPDLDAAPWDRTEAVTTVVISHVLNELDDAGTAELRRIIDQAQVVIWVEPGTSDVAGRLVSWREELRGQFHLIHPCPHQGACGLLAPENARHWCHHFAPPPAGLFADSDWVKFGQRAGIDLRSLPYSTLVLERRGRRDLDDLPADAGRVIGRPEVFKPYARMLGCDAAAVRELTLPKRVDRGLWKRLDRADAPRLFRWTHTDGLLERLVPIPPEAAADPAPEDRVEPQG